MGSYKIWPLVSGLFHLALGFSRDLSCQGMHWYFVSPPSNYIPWYGSTTFYLFHSSVHMIKWPVGLFHFCLLWTMVLGIFIDEVLGDYMSSVLCIYLGVEWLHHWLNLFNFFRQWQTITFRGHSILLSHQQCMRVLVFPILHQKWLLFVSL